MGHPRQGAGGGLLLGRGHRHRGAAALLHGAGRETVRRRAQRGGGGVPGAAGEAEEPREDDPVRESQVQRPAARGAGGLLRDPGVCQHPQPSVRPCRHHVRTLPHPILDILWRHTDW